MILIAFSVDLFLWMEKLLMKFILTKKQRTKTKDVDKVAISM